MKIVEVMPPMLNGDKLTEALQIYPEYDVDISTRPATERLIALQDIYNIYVPSAMSREIYSKLYLSLLRSLQKKQTIMATRQHSENARIIRQKSFESIVGGADSYTIIGGSGIGKSSAVSRAISILMKEPILEFNGGKLIPCLLVQCPADTSVKGLLLEILRKVDEYLDSSYYSQAIRAKSTVDTLIGSVSQVALNHLGLLIIDEIQGLVTHKNGKTVIATLTQLINNAGLSIVMVGTPECEPFYSSEKVLARRAVGLSYREMEYTEEYKAFVDILLRYNYTQNPIAVSETLYSWLYAHSDGNVAITVQLIHDGQEIAILNEIEVLDISTLNMAFEKRMRLLHDYIKPDKITYSPPKKSRKSITEVNSSAEVPITIAELSLFAKRTNKSIVSELKANGFYITEVLI